MTASLKAHQKEGVAWIVQQLEHGGGVVLADDVGMGKTRQGARAAAEPPLARNRPPPSQRVASSRYPFSSSGLAPRLFVTISQRSPSAPR